MNLKDLYINYFVSKGHKQIPSAPVVPENDASVLFNTAGMQPLIPYLMGMAHPYGTRLCDYQKCIRTNDLDEVGDTYHHTFFEMLGNWSLGDYFKKDAITYSFEFLTKILNIPIERLAVTVFEGDESIPRDEVSAGTWKKLGISERNVQRYMNDLNSIYHNIGYFKEYLRFPFRFVNCIKSYMKYFSCVFSTALPCKSYL